MVWLRSDHATGFLDNIVHVDAMNNDIANELKHKPSSTGNMDLKTTAIDGFITSKNKLLAELDVHSTGEDDPEWFRQEDGVAEGSRLRINHVVIGAVIDNINSPQFSAVGAMAKPFGAISKAFPVLSPVGIAPPAFVDSVVGYATILFLIDQPPVNGGNFRHRRRRRWDNCSKYEI